MWLLLWFLVQVCFGKLWEARNETDPTNRIVVYWGQDAAGNYIEKNLSYYCSKDYDVIIMSFMIAFYDQRQPSCAIPNGPDLNFANHGDDCQKYNVQYPNCPFLLNCTTTIGYDIPKCQSMNKKIMLSLGGAVGSYGFTSNSQGTQFANEIWSMFFEGTNSKGIRPFGNSILDGIDLDIEGGSYVGYGSFVTQLRSLMSSSKKKEYIISGAPQCVYPDAYLGPGTGKALTEAGTKFSFLNVQFYNNYCGAKMAKFNLVQ